MMRLLSSTLGILLVAFSYVGFASAQACPQYDAKALLAEARAGVVTMLEADASKFAELEAQITSASDGVDAALALALTNKATPTEKLKVYRELKGTWEDFKRTRDGEIIPALKAGKKDQAKVLATGIQAERFKKMNELLALL